MRPSSPWRLALGLVGALLVGIGGSGPVLASDAGGTYPGAVLASDAAHAYPDTVLALNDADAPARLPSLPSQPSADQPSEDLPSVDAPDADAPDSQGSSGAPARDETPATGDEDWLGDEFSLDDEFDAMSSDDPLEPVNRGIFAFNRQVDRFMLTPMTDVYQTLVPTPGRQGVHNVFLNIDAPVRMTNAMLQGRPKASGIALGRFIFNTTFGLGGLIDVGERIGLKKQRADFGQTLATWGAPQGPYMIFPFLGPMTLRHGVGMGVDFVMQPVSYVVGPLPGMIVGAGKDFSRREQHVLELETLQDASLDFYASLRSAFLQDRADVVAAGARDSKLEHIASTDSDRLDDARTPEEIEARCLAKPRARRELAKPHLRSEVRDRCEAAAQAR